jgi:hypothetical protein
MAIQISTGEWISALKNRMGSVPDGTIFHLPTPMHHHAFLLVKDTFFPERDFTAKVES